MKHKTLVKYFKKFGTSNALNGTEDNSLFEASESSDNNINSIPFNSLF
jgi:hypothetical protein